MKRILLTPYPGEVLLVGTREECQRVYKKLTGKTLEVSPSYAAVTIPLFPGPRYLIWARGAKWLAHELSHACLELFKYIECDPREGSGEPFAYLMGHLMEQALKK